MEQIGNFSAIHMERGYFCAFKFIFHKTWT